MSKHRIMQTTPRDIPETIIFWSQQSLVVDAPFHLKFVFKLTHHLSNTTISIDIRS